MITLVPGESPTSFLQALEGVLNDLASARVVGSAKNALDRYLLWAYRGIDVLGSHLRNSDLERLVTTKRFWSLQAVINPQDDSMIRHFINLEISDRERVISQEIAELKEMMHQWKVEFSSPTVVILDTNILLEHHHELASYGWNVALNLVSDIPIILTVPVAVVDELDRLKRSNTKGGGSEPAYRTKARLALRMLDEKFKNSNSRLLLRSEEIITGTGHQSSIHLAILMDEIGHVPIDHADAEIVDRALTLAPFVREVRVATYDTGMALRVRQAGLNVCKFVYGPEATV